MSFTVHGREIDDFTCDHIHPIIDEILDNGRVMDAAIQKGELPPQENIDEMFIIADKVEAQGKFLQDAAVLIREEVYHLIDEGTGALAKAEEEEDKDEVTVELELLLEKVNDVTLILKENNLDDEIIEMMTDFADNIELLL